MASLALLLGLSVALGSLLLWLLILMFGALPIFEGTALAAAHRVVLGESRLVCKVTSETDLKLQLSPA